MRLPRTTALELDPGLFVDTDERTLADPFELGLHRHGQIAERFEGADAARTKRPPLAGGDPGDEAQVVVRSPSGRTLRRPATDVAVLDRLRVCRRGRIGRRRLVGERGQESVACAAVVGHVVVDTQPLDGPGTPAEGDVEPLRLHALDAFQLVDVGADLEDRARLHVARQLGVRDLVVVRAPAGRAVGRVDAEQEVGVAAERPIEEGRLVDHVVRRRAIASMVAAAAARSWSPRSAMEPSCSISTATRPSRAQVGQEARFVLEAALADDVELRIVADRTIDETGRGGAFELGQMLAGEEGDKVSGGIDGSAVDAIHALQP